MKMLMNMETLAITTRTKMKVKYLVQKRITNISLQVQIYLVLLHFFSNLIKTEIIETSTIKKKLHLVSFQTIFQN